MADIEKELQVTELIQQGEGLAAAENYNEAILRLQEAEKLDPENVKVYMDKSIVYMLAKRYDEATREINKALILDNTKGASYFQLGNIQFYQKDLKAARSSYAKAIDAGYKTATAYFQMATISSALKDLDNAIYYYNKTLQVDPYHEKALARKIEILIHQGKGNEAYVASCELVNRRPEYFEGYHYKFMSLLRLDKRTEAKEVIDHAIEIFPNDMGLKYDLVMYYDYIGEYEKAIQMIEAYFEADPVKFKRVKYDKARILYKMRDFEKAEITAKEILQKEYSSEMAYYVLLSRLHAADYESALYYANLIKDNKANSEPEPYYASIYYVPLIYLKKGDKEKADEEFKKAINELRLASINDPSRVNLYIFRALSYKAIGDTKEALRMADYLVNLTKGDFKEAYFVRALIYEDMGETEKANADMEKVKASTSPLQNYLY